MISGLDLSADPFTSDRLLVVGESHYGHELVTKLRTRYADLSIATCDTYLSAIADVSGRPSRAVLNSSTKLQPARNMKNVQHSSIPTLSNAPIE